MGLRRQGRGSESCLRLCTQALPLRVLTSLLSFCRPPLRGIKNGRFPLLVIAFKNPLSLLAPTFSRGAPHCKHFVVGSALRRSFFPRPLFFFSSNQRRPNSGGKSATSPSRRSRLLAVLFNLVFFMMFFPEFSSLRGPFLESKLFLSS